MNSTTKSKKLLIVSSDSQFRDDFSRGSTDHDADVQYAANGRDGIQVARLFLPEIVLVGDDLADMSPVELARRIRNAVPPESTPIVVVSVPTNRSGVSPTNGQGHAANGHPVKVNGDSDFAATADSDDRLELLVEHVVEAIHAGKQSADPQADSLTCHDIRLDRNKHRVWVEGRSIRFTPTEFKLLWELASRPGYVLSRHELARLCKRNSGGIQARTIDAHIKSIRRKLAGRSALIETVHGVGYRFLDVDAVA